MVKFEMCCWDCGMCFDPNDVPEHAFETGHLLYRWRGQTKAQLTKKSNNKEETILFGVKGVKYKKQGEHYLCDCQHEDCCACDRELDVCIICGKIEVQLTGAFGDQCFPKKCPTCNEVQVHVLCGWICKNGHGF